MRRRLPVPAFTVEQTAATDGTGTDGVVVTTDRACLRHDGRPFSLSGLVVETTGPDANRWRWGQEPRDLGGTGRTLDDVDGRMPLEAGILARDGITALDDSESFLFADDGWIGTRVPGRRDVTVFAYGRDYDAAPCTYHAVSGPPSRMPRWALGNWWSRYHLYSDTSYLELLDRFADEHLPFLGRRHRHGLAPGRLGAAALRQRLDGVLVGAVAVPGPRGVPGRTPPPGDAHDAEPAPGRRRAGVRGRLPCGGPGDGRRPGDRAADPV
ncbi:hypothetical protein Q9Q99_19980 [Curtobacterium flaccumfaciens]|nr:hypothetical protein Q9Q99_19980 [Curtobacterium flaccumfaciens]